MSNKNIRHLRVIPQLLVAMCQEEDSPRFYSVTKNPLPRDTVCIGMSTEHSAGGMIIILELESNEFTENVPDPLPPVEHTQMIAIINIGPLQEKEDVKG
ncbi:hypothetical protein LCGC14_1950340 [marine sediment metagenome]|uniref:Uncharacterized protein n=1 Tax=marine sediment metagenome TaxID=412755 RepID=A0A0F9HW41_9ZZZZ